jgi:methionyl-tRNA synthetase
VAATRLDELLGVLAGACRILATELQPFIPAGASALSSQFRTHRGSIAQPTPVFARLKTPD